MGAMALAAMLMVASSVVASDQGARVFAAHALALRNGAVAGEDTALAILVQMPGIPRESVSELWPPFFENTIVKLGRLRSSAPVALYYNPLLDVAVHTLWKRTGNEYRVTLIRAFTGEPLAPLAKRVVLQPQWTTVKTSPIEALRRAAVDRLESFRKAHPASAMEGGLELYGTTFAQAAADMRAVLPRLLWNMAMRVHWTGGSSAWLAPVLEQIDMAFAAHDAAAIRAAAPDTDPVTAAALASLPTGFAAGLRLDMTLDAGRNDRLVVASLPEDGHLYAFALCRIEGKNCRLRRLFLATLTEWS